MNTENIEKICNRVIKSKHIHESVVLVENSSGDFSCKWEYGGKDIDAPLLMASITKWFTAACILVLQEKGKLSLDDKLSAYFDSSLWTGLHIYHGQEYSSKLTITNLLFQTSGLPDAFEEGKHSLKKQLIREDMQVSFDEMIEWTKQLEPHFAPGTAGKAYYADINFDMLGKIIETVTDCPLAEVFKTFIFDPLGLEKTYLPSGDDFIPAVYYKEVALSRPNFIKSCAASGGAISTARELMVFLKASIDGRLFHKDVFEQLKKWNKLQLAMYPIQYGGGLMCIPLGGLGNLFMGKGELVGHDGSTGSFAFYYPEKDVFFVGDVNQMAKPIGIRLAMQLAMALK